jgi:hypothetical protein
VSAILGCQAELTTRGTRSALYSHKPPSKFVQFLYLKLESRLVGLHLRRKGPTTHRGKCSNYSNMLLSAV